MSEQLGFYTQAMLAMIDMGFIMSLVIYIHEYKFTKSDRCGLISMLWFLANSFLSPTGGSTKIFIVASTFLIIHWLVDTASESDDRILSAQDVEAFLRWLFWTTTFILVAFFGMSVGILMGAVFLARWLIAFKRSAAVWYACTVQAWLDELAREVEAEMVRVGALARLDKWQVKELRNGCGRWTGMRVVYGGVEEGDSVSGDEKREVGVVPPRFAVWMEDEEDLSKITRMEMRAMMKKGGFALFK